MSEKAVVHPHEDYDHRVSEFAIKEFVDSFDGEVYALPSRQAESEIHGEVCVMKFDRVDDFVGYRNCLDGRVLHDEDTAFYLQPGRDGEWETVLEGDTEGVRNGLERMIDDLMRYQANDPDEEDNIVYESSPEPNKVVPRKKYTGNRTPPLRGVDTGLDKV